MRAAGQLATTGTRHPNEFKYRPALSENGKPFCSQKDCEKESRTRGMCQNHYMKWRRQQKKAGT